MSYKHWSHGAIGTSIQVLHVRRERSEHQADMEDLHVFPLHKWDSSLPIQNKAATSEAPL
jgi:hypothetical protein